MHPRGRTTTLRRPNSSSQRGPASPQRAGEAAQNDSQPLTPALAWSAAFIPRERPPPRACQASLLPSEQPDTKDERPRDGPLRLPNEDVPTDHLLDRSDRKRTPTFTKTGQRLRAAREARLFCRWNTSSRGTSPRTVDGDHPEEEEESEESAEEDAPGGHGRRAREAG